LREDLEKLTVQNVMKENTEMQQAQLEQNKLIPTYIWMY